MRSLSEPSSSPTTIGAMVSRTTRPGPRFVPPHSTMHENSRSAPTISAIRSWISPLPSETNASILPVATSGSRAARWKGDLTAISAKSKSPSSSAAEVTASSATVCSAPLSSYVRPGSRSRSTWASFVSSTTTRRVDSVSLAAVIPPIAPPPTTSTLASIMGGGAPWVADPPRILV